MQARPSQAIEPAAVQAAQRLPERLDDRDDLVTEVVVTYHRTIFDVRHCDAYTIGDAPDADFQIHAPLLPGPRFPLIRRHHGVSELCFTRATTGELHHDDRTTPLIALIDPHRRNPSGVHTVPLPPNTRAEIHLGAVTFTLRSVPRARRFTPRDFLDPTLPPYLALAAFVLLALLALSFHRADPAETLDPIPTHPAPRFTAFFAIPPQPPAIRGRDSAAPLPGAHAGEARTLADEPGELGKPHTRIPPTGALTIADRTAPGTPRHLPEDRPLRPDNILGPMPLPRGHFLGWHDLHARRLPGGPDEDDVWGRRGFEVGEARGDLRHGLHAHAGALGDDSLFGGYARTGDLDGGDRRTHHHAVRPLGSLRPLLQSEAAHFVARRTRSCGPLRAARVHFTVNGAGLPHTVTISATTRAETRAATCVAATLRRTWFPKGLGSVRVTYPVAPPAQPPDFYF